MDEDIKPLLHEIAAELRARNKLFRDQQRKTDEARSQILEMSPVAAGDDKPHFGRPFDFSTIDNAHQETMKKIREDGEQDRAERREFQEALLNEIRRLNHNLEAFISKR